MSHSWMRTASLTVLIGASLCAQEAKPRLSTVPLSPDQIAFYRVFLASGDYGLPRNINLENRTMPLELERVREGRCLQGVTIENESAAAKTVHRLKSDMFDTRTIRLVGRPFPASVMRLSEVALDANHEYAVMIYSYDCGPRCGHGGVVVFQKVEARWTRTDRVCSRWIF